MVLTLSDSEVLREGREAGPIVSVAAREKLSTVRNKKRER